MNTPEEKKIVDEFVSVMKNIDAETLSNAFVGTVYDDEKDGEPRHNIVLWHQGKSYVIEIFNRPIALMA